VRNSRRSSTISSETVEPCRKALKTPGHRWSDPTTVVLVGGHDPQWHQGAGRSSSNSSARNPNKGVNTGRSRRHRRLRSRLAFCKGTSRTCCCLTLRRFPSASRRWGGVFTSSHRPQHRRSDQEEPGLLERAEGPISTAVDDPRLPRPSREMAADNKLLGQFDSGRPAFRAKKECRKSRSLSTSTPTASSTLPRKGPRRPTKEQQIRIPGLQAGPQRSPDDQQDGERRRIARRRR